MHIPQLAALLPSLLHLVQPEPPTTGDSHTSATIIIPHRQPSFAERIDPRLVAFSIEADRWPDWAGQKVGQPNEFTQQLLKNLEQRTGVSAAIRVGADSEDRTHLDLDIPVGYAKYPPRTPWFPYPEAERISVGRDWYALSHNFAPGTAFTWGLNFKSLNISETAAQAAHLAQAFRHKHRHGHEHALAPGPFLEAVEIGNEPELYIRSQSGGGVSNPGDWSQWTVGNYSRTWTTYAKAVAKELDLGESEGETVLRIGDIQFAGSASGWAPQSIIQAGLFDDASARKHVKVYSEHMYQANYDIGHEAESGVLMDKWAVRGNLSRRAMDVVACKRQGLDFVLGETSTYSSHGSPGTSNVAESALWAIDFLLQSASMGISRAYLSHGVGYRYSSFQPIAGITDDGRNLDRAHIMPLYYGLLVVNEAIGKGKHSRYVAELGTVHPNIVSYGIYEREKLVRVVLVNTQVYAGGERKSVEVRLEGLEEAVVKRLEIPATEASDGLAWAGQDFDHPSGEPVGDVRSERIKKGKVTLLASSAVLVEV